MGWVPMSHQRPVLRSARANTGHRDGALVTLEKATRRRRSLPVVTETPRAPALQDTPRDIDRRMRPIYAVWEVTLACDLACRHCGSRAGHPRPDELSRAECLDLVDQLAALGVHEVSLIGGEAYLRDDWLEIVARIASRGMVPLLTTGGRGMDADRAVAAKAAGLRSASVSLDGMRAAHDELRNLDGSFDAARQALRNLSAAGIPISVNTQLNKLTMSDLSDVLDTLVAHGAHSWQIQLTVAMGRAADAPEVLLQPYDLLELFPLLGRLKERCVEAGVTLWPGNNVGYFGPVESALRGSTARGHAGSCGAGCTTLGIESDGTIKGCPSLATETWNAGTIRDHALVELWERAGRLQFQRQRPIDHLWGFCATCYYAAECRAGCTWTSESLLGRPGNNPMCHHRALEHQRLGKRERLVQVDDAPGRPFDHGRFEIIVEDAP